MKKFKWYKANKHLPERLSIPTPRRFLVETKTGQLHLARYGTRNYEWFEERTSMNLHVAFWMEIEHATKR